MFFYGPQNRVGWGTRFVRDLVSAGNYVRKQFTLKALAGVIMMMVFGTGTMVSSKMMLETRAVTLTGRPDQTFDKPWCVCCFLEGVT